MTILIRSRRRVRTWTAALMFVAILPAGHSLGRAAGRAEQPDDAALGPNMPKAFAALVERPTAANLQAVRGLLAADRAYSPYSNDLTQLDTFFHEGKNQEFVELLIKSQPNLLLSPRAHRLAAQAAEKIGDKDLAARETVLADRCADAILATGDGSESRPFLVSRVSDEADLLDAKFKTRIGSQGLVFRDDRKYDRILGNDGKTYWFDVSMPVDRLAAAQAELPHGLAAHAAVGPEQARGQESQATLSPEQTRGLEARATGGGSAGPTRAGCVSRRAERRGPFRTERGDRAGSPQCRHPRRSRQRVVCPAGIRAGDRRLQRGHPSRSGPRRGL